jgi:hypothetical protein
MLSVSINNQCTNGSDSTVGKTGAIDFLETGCCNSKMISISINYPCTDGFTESAGSTGSTDLIIVEILHCTDQFIFKGIGLTGHPFPTDT